MLNSAAGVTLPSAIAPPIRTIDSGRASGCCASRSATFVSGPVGDEDGARRRVRRAGRRRARRPGSRVGGGRSGPSSPVSPCTSAATRSVRTSGRSAPCATGISVRPASSSTRSALAVVFATVWLPATVVTAAQLELGRGEREQKRDRVVVARVAVEDDRRRHAAEPTFARAPSAARARARRARGRRGRARSRPSRRRAGRHGCRAPRRRSPARRPDRGTAARCTRAGSRARGRAR